MNLSVEQLAKRLETALGADAVTVDASGSVASHAIEGKLPEIVCRPQSAEQIAAALRLCTEAEVAVIPRGGGTAMAVGNSPRQTDVVIDLGKLNRMIEHDHANLTATVHSGITLSALQSLLAPQTQFAPLDAPFPERATVGGIVAANLNGPRRSYYGSVRDLVIGMKVVFPGGEQIKAGGKVVKNVAGYDMCKLFVGSLGTLGIITEVTLRMSPIPESAATVIASATLAQAERFTDELSHSQLLPAAVFLSNDGDTEQWRLAVWCEGFEETVARHLRDLDDIAARVGMNTGPLRGATHDEFWERLRDFPLQPDRLIYRVALPRAKIFDFTRHVQNWGGVKLIGDLAAGTVWLALPAHRSALEKFVALIEVARQQHGHAVVFAAPAELKQGVEVWGPSPTTISLQREIKRQFDPKGLLNPGRFLAGL
jgi:glycolate dehydrogenase FAD-binding subunit